MPRSPNSGHIPVALAVALLWCSPADAQSSPDWALLDSLFTQARTATTTAGLPATSRCALHDPTTVRLCEGTIALFHQSLVGTRDDLLAANDLIVRAVNDEDKWPYAWYLLGLVRLRLARERLFSREGPAQPAGMSNELGAANAFLEALRVDAGFTAAAEALALAPEPREGVAALRPRVSILRSYRSVLSPAAIAASALVEREAGSIDSAVALERRALRSGQVDSGVVSLSLARDLYRMNAAKEARAILVRGAGTPTEPARQAYRDELSWTASPNELSDWDSLRPGDRPAWIAAYWARRDVAGGLADGERLVEHYRRVEYAMSHFRIELPQTGRQQLLTFDKLDSYSKERQGLAYAERHGDLCPNAARFAEDAKAFGADSPERYYRPAQDLVDDRGAVWIRHGPPSKVRQSTSGEAVEVWLYERAGSPLVLQFRAAQFQGTSGAAVLVPSLLSVAPGVRNQVCELLQSLCPRISKLGPLEPGDTVLIPQPVNPDRPCRGCNGPIDPVTHRPVTASRFRTDAPQELCRDPMARVMERFVAAEGNLLNGAAIMRARTSGREQIDMATRTDSYQRTFAAELKPILQVYGLSHLPDESPRLVMAFALPGESLGHATIDSGGRTVYPVAIRVISAALTNGQRTDLDTLRQFIAQAPLKPGQFIAGMLEVPMRTGRYTISIVFSQSDGHGAIAHLHEVVVPGSAAALQLSDLVLGRENSSVHWNSGTTVVPLNPLNTYPFGGSAEVYFQLSGLTPGTSYQSKFEIFRAGDDPKHAPRLTVSFSQDAPQAHMEVSRTLGLNKLDPGRYRLRLVVSGGGSSATAVQWLTIVK
jgi:hypothetical protein